VHIDFLMDDLAERSKTDLKMDDITHKSLGGVVKTSRMLAGSIVWR